MDTTPRVMVDGEILPAGVPAAIPLDDGLVRGDGVFEGLRCYDRRLRTPDAHLQRLARSAGEIDLPVDLARLAADLMAFCEAVSSPSCGVRVMLTRGGRRIIREEALPVLPASWALVPQPHRPTPLLAHSKTLSYAANMQAARRARDAGGDEALLVDADSERVLEGPTSSFLWLEGERVVAPPVELGILDSITRRLVAEVTPLTVRPATLAELADANGGMLVSTVLESQAVHRVAGVAEWDPDSRRLNEVRRGLADLVRARTADPVPAPRA